jgi:hypothetical protein
MASVPDERLSSVNETSRMQPTAQAQAENADSSKETDPAVDAPADEASASEDKTDPAADPAPDVEGEKDA